MMSKKMKYALKALIYVANAQKAQVKTCEIAESAQIPKKFLEQILLDLKKGRIIGSKQGNEGGFHFVKNPKDVTLADIYRLIDGPIALLPCVSKYFYEPCDDCQDEESCSIRHALIDVRDGTLKILESKNIAQLAAGHIPAASNWSI